jgi:hypothetical protein
MLILVSCGIITLGVLLKFYYKKGFFHNTISIPVISIGSILFVGTLIGNIQKRNVTTIFDLSADEIKSIEVTDTYNYYISQLPYIVTEDTIIAEFLSEVKSSVMINDDLESTLWYLDTKITLKSEEELFAVLYKRETSLIFSQVYKVFFIPIADQEYKVSENIMQIFSGKEM